MQNKRDTKIFCNLKWHKKFWHILIKDIVSPRSVNFDFNSILDPTIRIGLKLSLKGVFGIKSENVIKREFKGKDKDNVKGYFLKLFGIEKKLNWKGIGNTFFKILIYLFQYYSQSHKSIEENPFMSKVFSTLQTIKISWQHFLCSPASH